MVGGWNLRMSTAITRMMSRVKVPWDSVLLSSVVAPLNVVPLSLPCDAAVLFAMVDDDDCGLQVKDR